MREDMTRAAASLDWNDHKLNAEKLRRLLAGPDRAATVGKILGRGADLFRLSGITPEEIVQDYPAARRFVGNRFRGMWDNVVECWKQRMKANSHSFHS